MSGIDVYKALADPTRRQILRLLREDDLPAGEIAEQFAMSWPSVSRHLGILSGADLVHVERRGQQLVYSLKTSVLVDIAAEIAEMARVNARQQAPAPAPRPATARFRIGRQET